MLVVDNPPNPPMKPPFLSHGLIGIVFASALLLGPAQETQTLQPSTPAVKSALVQVISKQLDAFHAGDYPKAYSFAATEIQKMFPPDTFQKMVTENYPILIHTVDTQFGVALDDGEQGIVFVSLTDAAGNNQVFRYSLRFDSGAWKITGVQQAEDPEPSKPPLTA